MTLHNIHTIYRPDPLNGCSQPLAPPTAAGFPSPADDFIENRLDLNELLISNPTATFFTRVEGNSMRGAGIVDGDILVVDRSRRAENENIIIAVVDGGMVVKRLRRRHNRWFLFSEEDTYPPIEITEERPLQVWGVVLHVIHSF